MNKYLEKIAEETAKKDKKSKLLTGTEAIVGTHMAKKVAPAVLGYHTLYHGTNSANAKSVKENGFDPSKGGTNNAAATEKFTENSKGYNHFTKNKLLAGMYAASPGKHFFDDDKSVSQKLGGLLKDRVTNGEILKTRVSHKNFTQNFIHDTDSMDPKSKKTIDQKRDFASKTQQKIDPKFVAGGKGGKGIFNFTNMEHLKEYYKTPGAKGRAGKGVALGAAGVGLLAHAISRLKKEKK